MLLLLLLLLLSGSHSPPAVLGVEAGGGPGAVVHPAASDAGRILVRVRVAALGVIVLNTKRLILYSILYYVVFYFDRGLTLAILRII